MNTTAAPEFRRDLAAAVVIALIALAFFAPVLFGPFHLPAGGGDLASFLFPMYRFIAQSLSAGDLPLWNPHQYAGAPLAADSQSGLLYPPHLLLFLLWPRFPYAALEWSVALHVGWASLGMYALLRSWRPRDARAIAHSPAHPIARSAAVLGAVAWMLSDGFVTHIGNLNYNAAAAWLPWALLGLHRAIEAGRGGGRAVDAGQGGEAGRNGEAPEAHAGRVATGASAGEERATHRVPLRIVERASVRPAILGGVALGIGALAGHAQVTFFTVVVLGAYTLWRVVRDRRLRPVSAFAIVCIVGAGLAAPMLLPALALRPHTIRAAYEYATTLEYSLPGDPWLEWLPSLFAPGLFGRGPAAFWGAWDRVEVGYLGVLPWILVGAALVPVGRVWGVVARDGRGERRGVVGDAVAAVAPSGTGGTGDSEDRANLDTEDVGHRTRPDTSRRPSAVDGHAPSGGGTLIFALLAVLAFLIALGPSTPVHRWLLGPLELPFRAPARFVLVADLGVAALAAFGMDRLLGDRAGGARAWAGIARLRPGVIAMTLILSGICALVVSAALTVPAAEIAGGCPGCSAAAAAEHAALWAERGDGMRRAAIGLVGLALASAGLVWLRLLGRLPARVFAGLAVLLLAFDLVLLGAGTEIQSDDPADGYRRDIAAAWLTEHAGLARIDAASGPWQPSAAQVLGLYDIGGVYNPLRLGRYGYVVDGLERRGSAVYNLLGARYVITAKGAPPSDADFIRPVFTDDPAVDIWENDRALPRVLLPIEAHVAPDDAAAFEALRAPGFDPERSVVFVEADITDGIAGDVESDNARDGARDLALDDAGDDLADPATTAPGARRVVATAGSAEIVAYRPDAVEIDVDLDRPAWVLLTDLHAPGWSATLDGAPADIVRADFAFRAVYSPAGAHRIHMRYTPPGWVAGLLIALAVVIVAGWAWWAAGGDPLGDPDRAPGGDSHSEPDRDPDGDPHADLPVDPPVDQPDQPARAVSGSAPLTALYVEGDAITAMPSYLSTRSVHNPFARSRP